MHEEIVQVQARVIYTSKVNLFLSLCALTVKQYWAIIEKAHVMIKS